MLDWRHEADAMMFRLSAQRHDGLWDEIAPMGLCRLKALKKRFMELWDSEQYAFVCIYNSKKQRRLFLGDIVRPKAEIIRPGVAASHEDGTFF